jgi:hypothetical protein
MFTHFIGIDNGVSGSFCVVGPQGPLAFCRTPVRKERNYTKEEHYINRLDIPKLKAWLSKLELPTDTTLAILERPMVNPRRFAATVSAVRSLEATLIVIEELKYFIRYVDSKEWQSSILPSIVGTDELKAASLTRGKSIMPSFEFKKDADALLMALWAKQEQEK